jgi:uncharacterized membrane protein YagU involved in acid resistance
MSSKQKNLLTTILLTGLLVGSLDLASALIKYKIDFPDKSPVRILRYIASAVFGKEKANSDASMPYLGTLFHFLIAYSFTIIFFLIYPSISFASKYRLLTGILYGLLIWTIMNRIVVPQTLIRPAPFNLKQSLIQATILIVAIGIPLSYIAGSFFRGKHTGQLSTA